MVRSSAAPRARRFISWTVKITLWWGTAFLMVRARSMALVNSGRTLIRLLIFSEKIESQPASWRASSWLCSSCWAVLHLANPTLVGFAVASGTAALIAGPISQTRPGPRWVGVRTGGNLAAAGAACASGGGGTHGAVEPFDGAGRVGELGHVAESTVRGIVRMPFCERL